MVFALHALRFNTSPFSHFELERRAKGGDGEAAKLLDSDTLMPRLRALRQILETLFIVGAISLTYASVGLLLGLIVSVALLLLLDTISRQDVMFRVANHVYRPYGAALLKLAKDWRWLDVFRPYIAKSSESQAYSKEELKAMVERSRGVLSPDEHVRFLANLQLAERSVSDVMTPVSVLDTADVHDALGPLVLDDLHKTGHSRFPVIDGDIHHVVGVLYLHELVDLRAKKTIREAMDPRVHYIHESQTLEHALHAFLQTHRHLFIVVNDYRETVGVLTLEDVIEAVLGKHIVDEFDQFEDLRAVAARNPRKNNLPKRKTDV